MSTCRSVSFVIVVYAEMLKCPATNAFLKFLVTNNHNINDANEVPNPFKQVNTRICLH